MQLKEVRIMLLSVGLICWCVLVASAQPHMSYYMDLGQNNISDGLYVKSVEVVIISTNIRLKPVSNSILKVTTIAFFLATIWVAAGSF